MEGSSMRKETIGIYSHYPCKDSYYIFHINPHFYAKPSAFISSYVFIFISISVSILLSFIESTFIIPFAPALLAASIPESESSNT